MTYFLLIDIDHVLQRHRVVYPIRIAVLGEI
nr:MAG TPA_asm: hypothetical protein [Caudoviricetes sp.]